MNPFKRSKRKKKVTNKKYIDLNENNTSRTTVELQSRSSQISKPPSNEDWTSHYDESTQRTYYENQTTGRTTWTEVPTIQALPSQIDAPPDDTTWQSHYGKVLHIYTCTTELHIFCFCKFQRS